MPSGTRQAQPAIGATPRGLLPLLPWVLVALLAALNLVYISRLGPNDDAFITYRVARNLATGQGLVYNPGERILSFTTPGYALILAAASVLSRDLVNLALAINGLALLALGGLLILLSRDPEARALGETRNVLGATLAVGLTLTYQLLSAALGMETVLYTALLVATFVAYGNAHRPTPQDDGSRHWLAWTAVLAAAAFLLRPDGALAGIAVGIHWLITRRRLPWRPLGLGVLLSLPWVVFAWAYYGTPVPNTLAAKTTQGLAESLPRWGPLLLAEAQAWAAKFPAGALLATTGLLVALGRRATERLPVLLWAALYVIAHSLLDVRGYYWYYVPLMPVVALMAGDGASWLAGLFRGQQQSGRRQAGFALTLLVAGLALIPAAGEAGRLARVPEPGQRDEAYRATAQALAPLCAGGKSVGMLEIGLIGYFSDCHVVDFAGLLQADLANLPLEPADKMEWAIKRYAPPLLVLAGSSDYPHLIADQAWFRQRYEAVDIQEERGFASVVYQKSLGPPAQRDLQTAAWWPSQVTPTQAETVTPLAFPLQATPTITLHAYLPPGSVLRVGINDQPLVEIEGQEAAWRDYGLLDESSQWLAGGDARARWLDGHWLSDDVTDNLFASYLLSLEGLPGREPLAVAWIESNALPAVFYFAPVEEASQRPRPTLRLDVGESRAIWLAPARAGQAELELLFRDRPGVRLAVTAQEQVLGVVGGSDSWRWERFALPGLPAGPVQVQLSSEGEQFARVAYLALVQP